MSSSVYVAVIEPNHISWLVAVGSAPGLVCMLMVLCLGEVHFCHDDVEDVVDAFRSHPGVLSFWGGDWCRELDSTQEVVTVFREEGAHCGGN